MAGGSSEIEAPVHAEDSAAEEESGGEDDPGNSNSAAEIVAEDGQAGDRAPPSFIRKVHGKVEESEEVSTVYLVGTAHVSKASCAEVEEAIRYYKPEAVFIELCKDRRCIVMLPANPEIPSLKSLLELWRTKKMNAFGVCYSYFLAKVANQLDVVPGAEFRTAFEEGNKCHADIFFGDRPVNITLQRTWSRMTLWTKIRLISHLLTSIILLPSVEELNKMLADMSDADAVTLLLREYSKQFPTLVETLMTERDLFMTFVLQSLARKYTSTVAVVGKGHVQGIIDNWEKTIEVKPLLQVPVKKSSKVGWIFGACGVALGLFYWKYRQAQFI